MTAHLKNPVPSPAIMEKIGTRFRKGVEGFASTHQVPVVRFGKDDRKQEVVAPYLARQAATGISGVAAIGVAQEYQKVWTGTRSKDRGYTGNWVWYSFNRTDRRVTCFYFYIWDTDFGGSFIKVCAYFPYPVKVWLNGHEWAKQQARRAGIEFTDLSNGFATCDDPERLQAICDQLGPVQIQEYFTRWSHWLPMPLDAADEAGGYWWELSMRQVETSRTLVFDAPRRARGFFTALVAENLDLGRPEHVELIFSGHKRRWSRPPDVEPRFKTRIDSRDTIGVTVNAGYKHSRVKQYLKDGRALRVETVINNPGDLLCKRRLAHLDELQAKARDVNDRLLDTERVVQGCVLASPDFERVAQSTLDQDGRRLPGLRFGDPRVMALLGALCMWLNSLGFTNRSLRA